MNTVNVNSQKSLKNIDWKSFFNMKIFRYSFLKQLKSISTYIFFCLTIVASGLLLWLSFSMSKWLMGDLNDLDSESLKELAKIPVSINNLFLYILFMIIFTLFITFKSLQIFRDEMDDGTLLIFSSMSYSRLKLIIQKWFSLQATCLLFTLSVIFVSPIIFLLIQGFSTPAWEITKVLYKNSSSIIIASIIFQFLISTLAVLISLYVGKTGTIGFLSLFSAVSTVLFFVPTIMAKSVLKGNSSQMYLKIVALGKDSEQGNLFKYYKDADLKELFELENWYTNQQFENIMYRQNDEQLKFIFDQQTLEELDNILSNPSNFDVQQKKQSFLSKNIKIVGITTTSVTPKAIKEIIELFNKTTSPKTINLCPILVKYYDKSYFDGLKISKLYEKQHSLLKTVDVYKTALDNNNNFTQKEKKITQFSKSLFENFIKKNSSSTEFVQFDQNTNTFVKSIAEQYHDSYGKYSNIQTIVRKNIWAFTKQRWE